MTEPAIINITKPISLKITKEINGLWFADLDIEKDDYIKPESYVEFDNELYIAKQIKKIKDKGKTFYTIRLEHIMIELIDLTIDKFDYQNKTPEYILTQFLSGTDWSIGTVNLTSPIDLKSERRTTILKALNMLADECNGELYFHKNRKVDLKDQIGELTELQLRYDKNCDYIEKEEDTSQLCTRLYPYGKDDITIESVNAGKAYLDSSYINNYKYRKEKVIFTNIDTPAKLKTYAEAYLAVYENPFLTYKINLADLSKSLIWQWEIINLGDTSRVYDADLNSNVKVRVKKIIKDYVSENIYVELDNKIDTIIKTLNDLLESLSSFVAQNDPTSFSFEQSSIPIKAIEDYEVVPVIYLGNPQAGIYQGPVVWMHTNCTAIEIMAYLKWIPIAGDATFTLNKNGVSVAQFTITQGEYVAPGEGEVGKGTTSSVNFSLAPFDRLNLDVDAMEPSDGYNNGLIVEVRCVK